MYYNRARKTRTDFALSLALLQLEQEDKFKLFIFVEIKLYAVSFIDALLLKRELIMTISEFLQERKEK
jgi:hypothetical protein